MRVSVNSLAILAIFAFLGSAQADPTTLTGMDPTTMPEYGSGQEVMEPTPMPDGLMQDGPRQQLPPGVKISTSDDGKDIVITAPEGTIKPFPGKVIIYSPRPESEDDIEILLPEGGTLTVNETDSAGKIIRRIDVLEDKVIIYDFESSPLTGDGDAEGSNDGTAAFTAPSDYGDTEASNDDGTVESTGLETAFAVGMPYDFGHGVIITKGKTGPVITGPDAVIVVIGKRVWVVINGDGDKVLIPIFVEKLPHPGGKIIVDETDSTGKVIKTTIIEKDHIEV